MNVFYTENNIKAVCDGDTVTLYLTAFGAGKYGGISFINLCDEGDEIKAGKPFGDCEAKKGVFDLISPVDGKVLEVNESVLDNPALLDEGAYLLKARADSPPAHTLGEEEYEEYIGSDKARFHNPREF